jgi:hypothetical protein
MSKILGVVSKKQENKTREKKRSDLPPGAKLDYREDVDRMAVEMREKLKKSAELTNKALEDGASLAKNIHLALDEQRKIFASIGINLGEKNPIVKNLGNKPGLDMMGELAFLAVEHEKKICDDLELTPKCGWDQAIAASENAAEKSSKGGTIGELSNILLGKKGNKGGAAGDGKGKNANRKNRTAPDNGDGEAELAVKKPEKPKTEKPSDARVAPFGGDGEDGLVAKKSPITPMGMPGEDGAKFALQKSGGKAVKFSGKAARSGDRAAKRPTVDGDVDSLATAVPAPAAAEVEAKTQEKPPVKSKFGVIRRRLRI